MPGKGRGRETAFLRVISFFQDGSEQEVVGAEVGEIDAL